MMNEYARPMVGFRWVADERQQRLENIENFLPHFTSTGVRWLVLRVPLRHESEEIATVVAMLRKIGVEPLLHLTFDRSLHPSLLRSVADRWVSAGIRFIALDEFPNRAARWSRWEPHGLPQRYARWIASFISIIAEAESVTPIFPPMAPGGDYWDITFLSEALVELRTMGVPWLGRLGVGCVNPLFNRPVTWGSGGMARWGTSSRLRRPSEEDQMGFRSWEWVMQAAEVQLERPVATFALATPLSWERTQRERAAEVRAVTEALQSESRPLYLGATFPLVSGPDDTRGMAPWFGASGTVMQPELFAALQEPPESRRKRSVLARASLRVLMEDGSVRRMTAEEYLRGVLPAEMGPGAPLEALKAQAVAARSYALRAIWAPRHTAEGADVCVSSHCQLWQPRRHDRTDGAVSDTAGLVATYEGRVIHAAYFACCGGETRNSEEVWRTHLPYCRTVSCVVKGQPSKGHGVGMCQRGAMRMAQQGARYDDILQYYYHGIAVESLVHLEVCASARRVRQLRIERRRGVRGLAGTMAQAGQPVTILDPWGKQYSTTSGSWPELGPNGWRIAVPVDALYRIELPGRQVDVAVQGDLVVLHAA